MVRRPRLEVEDGLYHLINRGVERRDIFHDDGDYRKFLSLLAALTGLSVATISRRHDAALSRLKNDENLDRQISKVIKRAKKKSLNDE